MDILHNTVAASYSISLKIIVMLGRLIKIDSFQNK